MNFFLETLNYFFIKNKLIGFFILGLFILIFVAKLI